MNELMLSLLLRGTVGADRDCDPMVEYGEDMGMDIFDGRFRRNEGLGVMKKESSDNSVNDHRVKKNCGKSNLLGKHLLLCLNLRVGVPTISVSSSCRTKSASLDDT
jgi:hypothetical protein